MSPPYAHSRHRRQGRISSGLPNWLRNQVLVGDERLRHGYDVDLAGSQSFSASSMVVIPPTTDTGRLTPA